MMKPAKKYATPGHSIMSPFYFIVAFFFLLRNNHAGASVSNNTYSTICSSSGCGNGVSIRYPFWVANTTAAEEFCGYPDFGLRCSDEGRPIITLPSDTYYVTDINYEAHTLTLVDIDVVNQSCPRARHNVTLGTLPLKYSDLDLNLSFYFNCSVAYGFPANPIGCFGGEVTMKQSYVFVKGKETEGYDWSEECEEKVEVVVKEDEVDSGGLVTGFGEAMNKGFVLNWGSASASDCAECEESDGYCGYNHTTNHMLCFCRDGSIRANRCNKGMIFSASLSLYLDISYFPTCLTHNLLL